MNDKQFPICTPEIPPMLGRSQIMGQLVAELTKLTPSHRSVVGPRFSGKSVILKQLVEEMQAENSPYCCVIEWDLRHGTPQTNQDFLEQLCLKLSDGLNAAGLTDYGKHLKDVSDGHYGEICEVLDCLEREEKVLMVWDGFDKPLCSGKLTRNLWDNLLELCRKPSFRLVTATRRELSSLIRDEESVTSDFWGVFGNVVRVGPFDNIDTETVLTSLDGYDFEAGAKTELANWTAGNPPLFLEVLNTVLNNKRPGVISPADINKLAESSLDSLSAVLGDLWGDCSPSARDLYTVLVDRRSVPVTETGPERRELIQKGFALLSGSSVHSSCRLLEKHIQGAGPDAGSMARLFGKWEGYRQNISTMLERRLSQLNRFDNRLFRFVEIAVSLLNSDPESALNNLTSIEERALDVIWRREFEDGHTFPDIIAENWTDPCRNTHKMVNDMIKSDRFVVPMDRWKQLGVLQLLTGSSNGFDPMAKYASKDAYVLLNAIHSYRNRNQHADGQEMHLGVAVAAMMTCIELLACLDRDTPAAQQLLISHRFLPSLL